MSSDSGSDSGSNHSGSPHHGPAPTPGHGLDRSASNSPEYANKSQRSPVRVASRNSAHSVSRSRSASAASNRSRSGSRSRSPSAGSNKSAHSGSQRSHSPASQKSEGSHRSRKSRSRSRSAASGSHRSHSGGSNRSGSGESKRSGSAASNRSRSGSAGSKKSRSRSGSPASNRSRSKSAASNRSRSRSKSASSNRSRSRSKSAGTNRSRSAGSNRSRSAGSNRSRSPGSNKSRSRSRSKSQSRAASQARSGSNSPNLQIDEPSSPTEKTKRDSSEEKDPVRKISKIIDTDSENDEDKVTESGVSAAAIFGDADDISSEEEKEKTSDKEDERRRSDEEGRVGSDEETEQRNAIDEDEEKENEPEPIPETRIDVEIPKISCDLGKDINFVKLPNFLSVETRPFDPETYEDEIDEEETLDEEGRARLKLKVENTIRWRDVMDGEGTVKKESNARIVRWSDGSYSLHLGSEIFDVYKQPLQGDHNHLFIRQGTGLQGQAVFRTKLSFRPHSTESFTHRKMTLSLADRSQKTTGIKILSQVGVDPDHDKATRLKKEEEKLRQTARPSKPRSKKGDSGSRSHNVSNVYREEEGSDEDGAISLNAIKNKYKSGGVALAKGGAIYSSDEEGSDIEDRRARKLDKSKALKESDTSEESE